MVQCFFCYGIYICLSWSIVFVVVMVPYIHMSFMVQCFFYGIYICLSQSQWFYYTVYTYVFHGPMVLLYCIYICLLQSNGFLLWYIHISFMVQWFYCTVHKRDNLIDLLQHRDGNVNIMQEFWEKITQLLTTEFTEASEGI